MARLPWTLDTELLLQPTRDPPLQLLLFMRSLLRLITIMMRSHFRHILVQAPVPVSQTTSPPSLLIPLMQPEPLMVLHLLLRRRSTTTHSDKPIMRMTCCRRTTTGFTATDQLARTTWPPVPPTATVPQLRQSTEHQRLMMLSLRLAATVIPKLTSCRNISSQRSHSV